MNDDTRPITLLVAVSGGPDSLALLLLAATLPRSRFAVKAATVDHGIRPEARDEAAYVAKVCERIGVPHRILAWTGWDGAGNLQSAARMARYRLLADEAYKIGATAILTAHHRNDQLETVLHAIERGDRNSRLAGMRPTRDLEPGLILARPFLNAPPERLRQTLVDAGIAAVDDPSNSDRRFARVRHRDDIAAMTKSAIEDLLAIQRNAEHHRRDREEELAVVVAAMMERNELCFDDEAGSILFAAERFRSLPDQVTEDLLARILRAVGGTARPADRASLAKLASMLREAGPAFTATLGGTNIRIDKSFILFQREYGRTGPPVIAGPWRLPRIVFDERFDIVLTEDDWRFAETGQAVLQGFGATGRGNARNRTMPVLLAVDGTLLTASSGIVEREQARGIDVKPFKTIQCRVRWRCLADLPIDRLPLRRSA